MSPLRTAQVTEAVALKALLDVTRRDVEDFCEERGVVCGRRFVAAHRDAELCSDACEQRRRRQRRKSSS